MLPVAMTLALTAQAQDKPFTQAQVANMVKDGFGDRLGAKLIEQRGIDFPATEDFVQSLKAAGASDAFLRALRAVKSPVPGSGKKPLHQVEVLALLAGQSSSHRVALLVEQRGIDFEPTDDYLREARVAGADDQLARALKSATITKPKNLDPALRAREKEVCRYAALGAESMRQRRYTEAETSYRSAVQLSPQNSDLHLGLAWALAANGRLEDAKDECGEALRLNPNNDGAHFFLARALGHEGDEDGEIAHYRAALRSNPGNTLAHLYLALALDHQQDWEGSVVQYREALRLDAVADSANPDFGPSPEQKDGWQGVIPESRKALLKNPNHENMRLSLGLALVMDDDWDGAITEERAVLSLNSNNALAAYILGMALEAKGNSAALQAYGAACALDPGNRDYQQAYERLRPREHR